MREGLQLLQEPHGPVGKGSQAPNMVAAAERTGKSFNGISSSSRMAEVRSVAMIASIARIHLRLAPYARRVTLTCFNRIASGEKDELIKDPSATVLDLRSKFQEIVDKNQTECMRRRGEWLVPKYKKGIDASLGQIPAPFRKSIGEWRLLRPWGWRVCKPVVDSCLRHLLHRAPHRVVWSRRLVMHLRAKHSEPICLRRVLQWTRWPFLLSERCASTFLGPWYVATSAAV